MLSLPTLQAAAAALLFANYALAQGRIADECNDFYFNSGWLVGRCLTGEDKTTRLQSAVSLNRKITNHDSHLEWVTTGEGWYSRSCRDCELEDNHILTCTCNNPWGGNLRDSLDLEDHIANYNGHLLSNLTGPVSVPSAPSAFDVPNDFMWNLNAGDVQSWCEVQSLCGDVAPVENPSSCSSTSNWRSGTDSEACTFFHAPVSIPMYMVFQTLTAEAAPGWEFEVYDNPECEGEGMGLIEADEVGVCKIYEKLGFAVKVTPRFNAA